MSDTERAETSETSSEEAEEEEVVRMPKEATKRQKENGEKMLGGHVVIEPEEEVDIEEKLQEIMKELEATPEGLTSAEAKERETKFGRNELPEKHVNPILRFLSFLWNPLSCTMEIAAILSGILGDWVDLGLIIGLLLFNATLSFYEEKSAGDALAALKAQLAATSQCMRDGKLQSIAAKELVPGDIIHMRLGDLIPADCKMIKGETAKVDQSSLTGESLPVNKNIGDELYSGAALKEGVIIAVVHATGKNSFFGKAASLVEGTESTGRLQQILTAIGSFCIFFIATWVTIELAIQFGARNKPCPSVSDCPTLENALVLIVGGIPIAMPTVLSVTMAIGASQLAKKNAIVSRLNAIEELAGMDVLCSDKTGTLTLNQLSIDVPVCFTERSADDVILDAALCSHWENADAIDACIVGGVKDQAALKRHEIMKFIPFDPVGKKTMATVKDPNTNKIFYTSKGAPQAVLQTANVNGAEYEEKVNQCIDEFASRGLRSLAVARADDEQGKQWKIEGMLPLFDPPRHDTEETIKKVQEMKCRVKMITGDHLAIGKETARRIGMGNAMYTAKELMKIPDASTRSELMENADGFAEVFPEHKYDIVRGLQERHHIVGMTGDGVNDAPALKKADIGIAVAGATDAARAAADIILVSPGLGVIVDAMIGSRKIFRRMKTYAQYSIATCVRIATTFALLTLIWDWYFPTIVIVVIAILNDGTIIAISKDRATPSKIPEAWHLGSVFLRSIVYGGFLALSSIILFLVIVETGWLENGFGLSVLRDSELRAVIYLQVSITGVALIFVVRAPSWFFLDRPGFFLILAFAFSQLAATFIAVYGMHGYPHDGASNFRGCGWGWALLTWIYSVLVFLLLDPIKLCLNYVEARFPKVFDFLEPRNPFKGHFNRIRRKLRRKKSSKTSPTVTEDKSETKPETKPETKLPKEMV